ncbi:cobalamin 5'-phosphate synthase [Paenibacillus sp. BIHB 4019]|uniref:Adenosylcobinamide-GDP ribazoletransferase n=1 Tax=Paenibacillus sp. BIHB 4019 TaxID=1870819 RepID=A0A1B2DPF4_9BACL|nr:adenosylcobinamide-GDP ribazoletransferase [Paenibacillus sp. BIHB 4019]ANY69582.1 cobalamin 5'-phosphate synthase [Paenibacillus sp. BIHB 4019]
MAVRSLKLHAQALVAAIQFLTRIPVPLTVPFEPQVLSRSTAYFSIAGSIIGGMITLGFAAVQSWLPAGPGAVLLLALWLSLSGALHMDGWMDTADGVLSHRSRERMLEIMKDSRVGAMGVLAAVLLVLFKFTVLYELLYNTNSIYALPLLVTIPAWSRWWMAAAIVIWPSAREGEGIGALFQAASLRHVWSGFVLTFLLACGIGLAFGLPLSTSAFTAAGAAAVTMATGTFMSFWLVRKLGGLTGDTYGAMNEAIEAILLLALLLLTTH